MKLIKKKKLGTYNQLPLLAIQAYSNPMHMYTRKLKPYSVPPKMSKHKRQSLQVVKNENTLSLQIFTFGMQVYLGTQNLSRMRLSKHNRCTRKIVQRK